MEDMSNKEIALFYASLGWPVAPIGIGTKHPKIPRWQTEASTDPAQIAAWWDETPTDGISILTGSRSGIFAVDIDPRHGGDESWDDLIAQHGEAGSTTESLTGGGGRHLIYRIPAEAIITNASAANLPIGIDIRGEGGQIVAPPTIHPASGLPYAWEATSDPTEGMLPQEPAPWLLRLLLRPIPAQTPRQERQEYVGTDSIVERFAADHTWPSLLLGDGWSYHSGRAEHRTGETYELWTRPGKDIRDGSSASLYYRGSDVLKVFTDQIAGLRPDETYTRFGYWTATRHQGDHSAAARAYRLHINNQTSPRQPQTAPASSKPEDGPEISADAESRPAIIHNGKQLGIILSEAIEAIQQTNEPPTIFVRAGQLCRLREDEEDRPIIEPLRPDSARNLLASSATWWRANRDGSLAGSLPPAEIASALLAEGRWALPSLAGIVETPVLRPDGTFLLAHSYDPATKLHLWNKTEPFPQIPASPSKQQTTEAVSLIDELLCDFPWDTTADRANAWAMLLTPLLRSIIGQVPLALIDAPEPGTGKGLLVKLAAIITSGRATGLMAWPSTDEELEKKVTAALISGSTMLIFDNVEGTIKSPTLAAVLTADSWQGRVLGRSEMITIPNRATWVATGNNIDVGGDLARRCYRIRLDAHQARPWARTGFKHPDIERWTTQNRPALLGALCTIIRAWWEAGKPKPAKHQPLGGYTSWSEIIGGILGHAGIDDFLGNMDAFHAISDREAQAWEGWLTTWQEMITAPMGVADLIAKMGEASGFRLREALPDDISGYWDTPSFSRRLGHALRKRSGRHYGEAGLHLVEMPKDRRKISAYTVETRSSSRAFPHHPAAEARDARDVNSKDPVKTTDGFGPSARDDENIPRTASSLSWDDSESAGSAGCSSLARPPVSHISSQDIRNYGNGEEEKHPDNQPKTSRASRGPSEDF